MNVCYYRVQIIHLLKFKPGIAEKIHQKSEQCTGIAKVLDLIPVRAPIVVFFSAVPGLNFDNFLYTCI